MKITVAAAVLLLAGCRELPRYFAGDALVARAGSATLRESDLKSVVPKGVVGDDSVALVDRYVDRWVRKQLKLREAEVFFSAAADDIDRMVEEYRQVLLIRKLEQHYVDNSVDTTFTDDEIEAYYDAHKADFRLDRPVVKGRIVRVKEGYRQARKLKELMASASEADQQDFNDLCAKNGFEVHDFRSRWVDFSEFLSHLPALQAKSYDSALASTAVQEMRDSQWHYYFRILEVRGEGGTIPLERLRPTIRRILFNQRQSEAIHAREEELYRRSAENGEVRIFGREHPEDEEE